MTTPTLTGAYTCTHHNDQQRAACPVCLVASLTAERDKLRAEVEKVYALVTPVGCDLGGGIFETAQAVSELLARADRAEADLAALEQSFDDNCRGVVKIADDLAAERARLDSGQILLTVSGERVWHCGVDLRAAIDAGMREGAK